MTLFGCIQSKTKNSTTLKFDITFVSFMMLKIWYKFGNNEFNSTCRKTTKVVKDENAQDPWGRQFAGHKWDEVACFPLYLLVIVHIHRAFSTSWKTSIKRHMDGCPERGIITWTRDRADGHTASTRLVQKLFAGNLKNRKGWCKRLIGTDMTQNCNKLISLNFFDATSESVRSCEN